MWNVIIGTPIHRRNIRLENKIKNLSSQLKKMGVKHTHTTYTITIKGTIYNGQNIDILENKIKNYDLSLY